MNILTSSALTVEVILGDQTIRDFTSDRNSSTLENSPLPIPEANAGITEGRRNQESYFYLVTTIVLHTYTAVIQCCYLFKIMRIQFRRILTHIHTYIHVDMLTEI